jgi:hypothetical protein
VKAKFALFLSILLSFYLLADGIEISADLDDVSEQEVSSVEAFVSTHRFKEARRSHSRGNTSAAKFTSTVSADETRLPVSIRTKKPSPFSQQELYRFQQIFRL